MKKSVKESSGSQASTWVQLLMPLAALVRSDFRELIHHFGMQAIAAMLEADRARLCGPRYKHAPSRTATRGG